MSVLVDPLTAGRSLSDQIAPHFSALQSFTSSGFTLSAVTQDGLPITIANRIRCMPIGFGTANAAHTTPCYR